MRNIDMKFIVSLIAFIAVAIAGVGALTNSEKVQSEVDGYFAQVQTEVLIGVRTMTAYIQARSKEYLDQFINSRDNIAAKLQSYGAVAAADYLIKEANAIISYLIIHLDSSNFQADINSVQNTISVEGVKILQDFIDNLKLAIDKKPNAISCWETNKLSLKSTSENFVARTRAASTREITVLEIKSQSLNLRIQATVRRIQNELKALCTTSACAIKYVNNPF